MKKNLDIINWIGWIWKNIGSRLLICVTMLMALGVQAVRAAPVQWSVGEGGNDHWYDFIPITPPGDWATANATANASTHLGMGGHLVTFSSAAENAFVYGAFTGTGTPSVRGYIGLFQPAGSPEPADGWTWVTGEPLVPPGNWDSGEPNEFLSGLHDEQVAEMGQKGLDSWNDIFEPNNWTAGYYVEYELPLIAGIDIKPESDPNCFNINGHGVIPVAILGNTYIDVSNIDVDTVLFGGLEVRVRGNKGPLCSIEDVNGDEMDDMVCQFEDDPGMWAAGTGTATLTGELLDGTPIEGTDSICVVP